MPARRLALFAAPIALASALLLAGCVPTSSEDPGQGGTSAAPTPTATGTPGPTPTTEPVITPITIGCDQLISPQAMYDFSQNVALLPSFTPEPGTAAAEAVDLGGLACRWTNQSSGENIDISVANLPADDLTARKNELVQTSNSVPTYEVEGYFEVTDGVGEAQAFDDPYWIAATSVLFAEPGDAQPLVAAAIAGLG